MTDLTGFGALAEFGTTVISRIWPDASEAEKAKLSVLIAEMDAANKVQLAQAAINQVEAGNTNAFVSSWRPAIGWCIAIILFYSYLIYPMSLFTIALMDIPIVPPRLPLDDSLWQLILGMLGLSVGRTVEKIQGVTR